MAQDAWDLEALEALEAKWQARWWAAGVQHADRPAGSAGAAKPLGVGSASADPPQDVDPSLRSKPTFFLHFAYPGISGFLHVGHMRGFTYTDVFARYKRM
ncbi:MAG TPA: hypothetical protein VHI93_05585, partial [Candidatus Thermoplasmatota archaeon]|nr:hypothetical protein [Candidatus Thermoplasmatota archaeon]